MPRPSPRYTTHDSEQTLREGLKEYYALNPTLLNPDDLPAEVATMFRRHDVMHVIFGCDTSLRGETLVDTWTIFGTTAGLTGYLQYYKYPQVIAIFAEAGIWRIAVEFVRALPDVVRVVLRTLRLKPKWPWVEYERLLDTTLGQLRRTYNIRIVGADA